jgi:hypothetical protein
VVGRWGETGGAAAVAERLTEMGASHVVFTLADARDRILKRPCPSPSRSGVTPGPPAP